MRTYRQTRLLVLWAVRDFGRNNCGYMAAGIAYWTLFSLFPLILASVALVGYLYPTLGDQEEIISWVVQFVPVSRSFLESTLGGVVEARGTLSWIAVVALLWAGLSVFSAIRRGINHAWEVEQMMGFVKSRLVDFAMLLAAVLFVLVTIIFTTNALGVAGIFVLPGWLTSSATGWLVREGLWLALITGILAALFRYIPNTTVMWKDTWLGALLGGLIFQASRLGLAWYLRDISDINLVYGPLGALIAVLLWAYISALGLMWGAQVSHTYSLVFGSRAELGRAAVFPQTRVERLFERRVLGLFRKRKPEDSAAA